MIVKIPVRAGFERWAVRAAGQRFAYGLRGSQKLVKPMSIRFKSDCIKIIVM